MAFFELHTARDMLDKAHREHTRLCTEFNIDNVFNFFVTAYHIQDYVRKTAAVPQAVLDAFLNDRDIRDCHDLCDKGKHLRLTQRPDPQTAVWSGVIGGAPINALPLGGGDRWVVFSANRVFDVQELADRVLLRWDQFFADNGL